MLSEFKFVFCALIEFGIAHFWNLSTWYIYRTIYRDLMKLFFRNRFFMSSPLFNSARLHSVSVYIWCRFLSDAQWKCVNIHTTHTRFIYEVVYIAKNIMEHKIESKKKTIPDILLMKYVLSICVQYIIIILILAFIYKFDIFNQLRNL